MSVIEFALFSFIGLYLIYMLMVFLCCITEKVGFRKSLFLSILWIFKTKEIRLQFNEDEQISKK